MCSERRVGQLSNGATACLRAWRTCAPVARRVHGAGGDREWMDRKDLSNKDVAKALRLSDGRVVRFWTSKKESRQIPYPSWYTLRHKFGK